jgi:hypothetical protein
MNTIPTQRTFLGHTAGGLLNRAHVSQSRTGSWHVWLYGYQVFLDDRGCMVLAHGLGRGHALSMSDRARRRLEAMLAEAEAKMLEGYAA